MNIEQLQALRGKRRTRTENAGFVIETIKSLGLTPQPQSRLAREHQVLADADGVIAPDSPDFDVALEAERDMQLLGFVFDHADLQDESFVRLVKSALKDSALPQDDRKGSKGRDSQFELFVAGVCYSAGLRPVEFAEPDVVCVLDGTRYGIAVKRVKSAAKLERAVRKAASQIAASGDAGVIALDTCLALNPDNQRIAAAIPQEEFGPIYRQEIGEFLDAIPELQSWIKKRGTLGILLHDHNIRWIEGNEWQLESFTMRIPRDDEKDRFERFAERYIATLPNLTRFS